MSARPWRKRRNMTPRRWRKYVERGGFRRVFVVYFPETGEGLSDTPSGYTRAIGPTVHFPLTRDADSAPNSAWIDFPDAPIGRITHAIIYPPERRK